MHCLIVRGEQRTVVRQWAPDTRLNGRTFIDSPLTPGDRLGVGRVEFEVLSDSPRAPSKPILPPPADEKFATDGHRRRNGANLTLRRAARPAL